MSGCGTTKWSDSPRTATEQLLVSDAIDRAISEIDFSAMANKTVFLDNRFIVSALDQNYVVSTLRQHMLASGLIIKDKPDDATYVVEVRTGSVGTNRQDLLFGIPSTTLPTVGLLPTGSATIPEIALVKRTNQQGVCKIAAFAYDRMSGRPVWQSGNRQFASRAKDIWVAGAGPFQKGTIYEGTAFAGERLSVPLVTDGNQSDDDDSASVSEHKIFHPDNPAFVHQGGGVNNAGFTSPLPPTNPATATPAAATTPASGTSPPAGNSAAPAAGAPANNSGASTPGATPATSTDPAPPKAAYTPPPTATPAAPPPAAAAGPQGNLTVTSTLQPTSNPAEATAGAIQTYNIARGIMDRPK